MTCLITIRCDMTISCDMTCLITISVCQCDMTCLITIRWHHDVDMMPCLVTIWWYPYATSCHMTSNSNVVHTATHTATQSTAHCHVISNSNETRDGNEACRLITTRDSNEASPVVMRRVIHTYGFLSDSIRGYYLMVYHLIQKKDLYVTHSYVWHVCVTKKTRMCICMYVTHSYVWHVCVTKKTFMCICMYVTHSYVWHVCVTKKTRMCICMYVTHSYVWHVCVTKKTHMCICVTKKTCMWRIHMCDMWCVHMCCSLCNIYGYHLTVMRHVISYGSSEACHARLPTPSDIIW